MKLLNNLLILAGLIIVCCLSSFAQETPIRYDFSGKTAGENKVILQSAGFGSYPQAEITFGDIPLDNAFTGATDGRGVIIKAKPGEGAMIFGQKISTNNAAMVRCAIRTDIPYAGVTIATIGEKPDAFVATNTPNNEAYFSGQYLRLAVFSIPPSGGFQPVVQIINTSKTETLTAYLDNLEIYTISPEKYYSGEFINANEIDPADDKISLSSSDNPGLIYMKQLTVSLASNIDLNMVLLNPNGDVSFTMGSPDVEADRNADEGPQHKVNLTKPFYIGNYEVTQEQWKAVMGNNSTPNFPFPSFIGNKLPANNVSWDDCQTFIAKLNTLGKGTFRLPTEAEWEYACRGGLVDRFYWGRDDNYSQAHKYDLSANPHVTPPVFPSAPAAVGGRMPNPYGLYDMSGNIWEWCQDWYAPYSDGAVTNPTGPVSEVSGKGKVLRGGCYYIIVEDSRSASRSHQDPNQNFQWNGLRLVREKE